MLLASWSGENRGKTRANKPGNLRIQKEGEEMLVAFNMEGQGRGPFGIIPGED